MKNLILSVLLLLLSGAMAIGQTTGTDFTANDCSGTSHHLFAELDGGKVVVLVWVMPCSGCISDAKASYSAARSFASSTSGVLYWLVDDQGNTTCSALADWADANGIISFKVTLFENAGNIIDEANYGGPSMPHVVVMGGGANHYIYYNKKNGSNDSAAIADAVTLALAGGLPPSTSGVTSALNSNSELRLFPNPAKDKISIDYTLGNTSVVSIDIYDVVGKHVTTETFGEQMSGVHFMDVNFRNKLASGMYFLKLNTGNASQTIKFTIGE